MKFDFLRTQENDLSWCIPTAKNTPTSGPWSSGTLQFKTPKLPLSIPESSPSLSPHPILWEETPNTRNNLTRYWNRPTTSSLVPSTGILWIVPKQNPDQAVPFPPSPPVLTVCQCRIDLCRCNYRPDMPPTPPYIELWKPSQELQPRRGVHYLRHSSFTESGSLI